MPAPPLIDAMTVANVGFLIDNLGKDAGELQYLRELVQNAFEAVGKAKRGDAGRVEIDFEEVNGVRKLRVTDNGVGMTSDEVAENINKLSATTGVQAFDKNFGIGAKITAAVRNPYGVMYKAWKGGEGSITILGRAEGRYGRIGWRNSESITGYRYRRTISRRSSGIAGSPSYSSGSPRTTTPRSRRREPNFHLSGWQPISSAATSECRRA